VLFKVTIERTLVVEALNELDARRVAHDFDSESASDFSGDITDIEQIKTESDLPEGWEPLCVPYGYGDGNTRISQILEKEN
jgi:hypothetical protein